MPIYEYACKKCSHTLDSLQKVSDAPLVDCPECGEPALRRLISAPRFRLKGDGWYETDFKKEKQRNVLKSDSEPPKEKAESKEKAGGVDSKATQPAKEKDTAAAAKPGNKTAASASDGKA